MTKVPSMSDLRKRLAKTDPSYEGGYLQKILRPLGSYLVKILLYTPISANQVTLLMLVIGFAAAVSFLLGEFILGAVLFWLVQLLDVVDGSIARYYGKSSVRGKYLDYIYHAFTQPTVLMSLAVGLFFENGNLVYLYLGISSSLLYLSAESLNLYQLLVRVTYLKQDFSKINSAAHAVMRDGRHGLKRVITNIAVEIFNATYFTTMSNIVFIGVVIGHGDWVLWFYGVLMPLRLIVLMPYYYNLIPRK